MNIKELLAAYPTVTHAIGYVELLLCTPDDEHPVSAWDMFIAGNKLTPTEVINLCKEGCREEMDLGTAGKWAETLIECDRPEFLTYLKGKMGAM